MSWHLTHTHTESERETHTLYGATKATKTQELIIVLAADYGTQTHTRARSREDTEQPGNLSSVSCQ